MEYEVLFDPNIHDLMNMVNTAIQQGWQPLGGIAPDEAAFYQAMVRNISEEKN